MQGNSDEWTECKAGKRNEQVSERAEWMLMVKKMVLLYGKRAPGGVQITQALSEDALLLRPVRFGRLGCAQRDSSRKDFEGREAVIRCSV